jgi:hypothetical protein
VNEKERSDAKAMDLMSNTTSDSGFGVEPALDPRSGTAAQALDSRITE